MQVPVMGCDHGAPIRPMMDQPAPPYLLLPNDSFHLMQRFPENGPEQLVRDLAPRLVCGEAVALLHRRRPHGYAAIPAANQHGGGLVCHTEGLAANAAPDRW